MKKVITIFVGLFVCWLFSQNTPQWEVDTNDSNRTADRFIFFYWQGSDTVDFKPAELFEVRVFPADTFVTFKHVDLDCIPFDWTDESGWVRAGFCSKNERGRSDTTFSRFYQKPQSPEVRSVDYSAPASPDGMRIETEE